jgi:hypothetical protein
MIVVGADPIIFAYRHGELQTRPYLGPPPSRIAK